MIKTQKSDGFFLEELDPRMKLLIIMVVAITSFMVASLFFWVWECILILLLYLSRGLMKQSIGVLLSMLVAFALQVLASMVPNETINMSLSIVTFLFSRFLIFFLLGNWITTKMRIGDFTMAFQKMKISKGLIITLAVVFRYMPTVKIEQRRILNTMKLRGIQPNFKNILSHPIATFEYVIVPLILRSFTIADQLSASAITRGLDLETERTCYRHVKLEPFDYIATAIIITLNFTGLYAKNIISGVLL